MDFLFTCPLKVWFSLPGTFWLYLVFFCLFLKCHFFRKTSLIPTLPWTRLGAPLSHSILLCTSPSIALIKVYSEDLFNCLFSSYTFNSLKQEFCLLVYSALFEKVYLWKEVRKKKNEGREEGLIENNTRKVFHKRKLSLLLF